MKHILSAFLLTAAAGLSTAAEPILPPAVGSVSNLRSFAVADANSALSNLGTADYDGSILVIMFMTPWCPFCQSNAQAVGSGLAAYFSAASRGALMDKNDNGVPIRTLLLSTEEAAQWDGVNKSFANLNGYKEWGLDALADRSDPRLSLGYFREGGFIVSTDLHDWGNDRRRLVVLNLVRNSASHPYSTILLNQNSYTSSNNTAARAAINAVTLPPPAQNFTSWQTARTFPVGQSAADSDPDLDTIPNALEFFHGTDPLLAEAGEAPFRTVRENGATRLVYREAKNLAGITATYLRSANLRDWEIVPATGLETSARDIGGAREITVTMPSSSDPTGFFRIKVTAN